MTMAAAHAAAPPVADEPVLRVRDLRVGYRTPAGPLWAVDGVDLDVAPGESLGLVGESGCGKSSLGRALLNLMPPGGGVRGEVRLAARGDEPDDAAVDLVSASASTLRGIRGNRVSLVFQEPMTRLDPLMRVSTHFVEAIRSHRPQTSKREARDMAEAALAQMGIPRTRVNNFPHEFSGGMRQRAMTAMALVCDPKVVVADEPTTALDVTIQAQVLELMGWMRDELDMALIFVTHDLAIVADICDRVMVMYAGQVVEEASIRDLYYGPRHPYSSALLAAMPQQVSRQQGTDLASIPGSPPAPGTFPVGCRFHPRCDYAQDKCAQGEVGDLIRLRELSNGQTSRCVRVDEIELQGTR